MSDLPATRPDRVLVVCSANQCRSPLAGALLGREVALRGLPVEVLTAGVSTTAGRPATSGTVEAAADLVIGMERLHVREAVVLEPAVWRRAFTLPDLVRRAEATGVRPAGEPLQTWLEFLSAGRDRMALMGASADDDVRDPTNDRSVDHRYTAELLDDLVRRLVTLAWPA